MFNFITGDPVSLPSGRVGVIQAIESDRAIVKTRSAIVRVSRDQLSGAALSYGCTCFQDCCVRLGRDDNGAVVFSIISKTPLRNIYPLKRATTQSFSLDLLREIAHGIAVAFQIQTAATRKQSDLYACEQLEKILARLIDKRLSKGRMAYWRSQLNQVLNPYSLAPDDFFHEFYYCPVLTVPAEQYIPDPDYTEEFCHAV